jgi:type I restriction enzyme S subunit
MSAGQNGLPPKWAPATLGDIVVFNYGKALPAQARDGLGFPVYGSNGIVGHHSSPHIAGPAIVVGRKGSIGEAHLSEGPCSPIDTTYFITEFHGQPPNYWLNFLRHLDLARLDRASAVPGLNRGDAYQLHVQVPPTNEQKRIVAKIEALQLRSSAAKEALDAIPPLLEKFRQSVLAAAFRGDLTKKWREAHRNTEPATELLARIRAERRRRWEEAKPRKKYVEPDGADLAHGTPILPPTWSVASVAEISDCLDRLRRPVTRADRKPGPYPYYGANGQVDSVSEFIFDDELVLVTEDETFYGRRKPIAYRVSGKCWVNNHAHVLRAVAPVPADYLSQLLMHYHVIPWLSGTTGRAKLTQGALNVLPIAVAPAAEMQVVARKVSDLLAFSDSVAQAAIGMDEPQRLLNQSILAKAFRGELVPQDPNDEPAAVLLERIRREREGNGASGRATKRRPGRRASATPTEGTG